MQDLAEFPTVPACSFECSSLKVQYLRNKCCKNLYFTEQIRDYVNLIYDNIIFVDSVVLLDSFEYKSSIIEPCWKLRRIN